MTVGRGPGGLILAAGAGTRFGSSESKLLAELEGRPLLERAVQAQCRVAALERVLVVLGARADEVLERVDFGRAEPIVCADWERGQASSLRFGLERLFAAGARRAVVTLGDEPLISAEIVARFVSEPPGTRAVYAGRPGHPVVLGPEHLERMRALSGDRGARELLHSATTIECGQLGSGRDVDTPEDLEEIRHEARAII